MKGDAQIDYYAQKILLFLKSYSITYEIKFEHGFYLTKIEETIFNVPCDNINESIFLSFFNWIGKKLEYNEKK